MPKFRHKYTGALYDAERERGGWKISRPDRFRILAPEEFIRTFEPAEPEAISDPMFNKDFFKNNAKRKKRRNA